MPQELSYEEISRMRQILAQHDSERKPMQTIDLNNPLREPYHFQAFPKMVYDLENSKPEHLVTLTVRNKAELDSAVSYGWSETAPAFGDSPEDELSPKFQAEAERVQEQIEQVRRKPGPKPKVA